MYYRILLTSLLFGIVYLEGVPPVPASRELPEMRVTDWVVANPEPAGTFEMPVSQLRYEWQVDLQSRNLAEAQGDVAIRGGIFENTGYRLGKVGIVDPQTGHYVAELPVSPEMLESPRVLVGMENAIYGLNASVGTVDQDWRRIENRGWLSGGVGQHGLWTHSGYWGGIFSEGSADTWAGDLAWSWSEGEGTRADGDHRFHRLSGRLQHRGEGNRTDIFAGYQSKYFQWPYLYALQALHDLVGSRGIESENLQTQIWMVTHRREFESGEWGASVFYRRNRDDYEFDIDRHGLFNPFQHETEVYGAGLDGNFRVGEGMGLQISLQGMADSLESSALTFGPFQSRASWRAAVVPEWRGQLENGDQLKFTAGMVYDGSNRDGSEFSPLGEIRWRRHGEDGSYMQSAISFSQATQLPGYTAIGSNPNGGLFRGNPDLRRERSRNWEWEAGYFRKNFSISGALFLREDRDLVDWIFDRQVQPFASRFAENVDIDTRGLELMMEWRGEHIETRMGATWLSKREQYERADVDGSFYALNFPKFRMAAGLVWRPWAGFQIQVDQEWRRQEPNPLREGREEAFLGQVGIRWRPQAEGPLEFSVSVENLWDVSFEQVPGVPGAGRQAVVGIRYDFL